MKTSKLKIFILRITAETLTVRRKLTPLNFYLSNMTLAILNGAIDFLNDQYWHDSSLREITINRTTSYDAIILVIDLLSDWKNNISSTVRITFKNCFVFKANMNGGVVCQLEGEPIHSASCDNNNPLIVASLFDKTTANNHAYFKMGMSSTGSIIEIVFDEIDVEAA